MLGIWYRFLAKMLGGTKYATVKMVFCDQVLCLKVLKFGRFKIVFLRMQHNVSGYTFRGINSVVFIFCFVTFSTQLGSTPKGKSRSQFGRTLLTRAGKQSQKLFPFIEIVGNYGGVLVNFK